MTAESSCCEQRRDAVKYLTLRTFEAQSEMLERSSFDTDEICGVVVVAGLEDFAHLGTDRMLADATNGDRIQRAQEQV